MKLVTGLPYRPASRLLEQACGNPWFQQRYLREPASLVRTFFREIGAEATEAMVRLSLTANTLVHWRLSRLSQMSPAKFRSLVEIRGGEHLAGARSAGMGVVIANSHMAISHLMIYNLKYLDFPECVTIGAGTSRMRLMGLDAADDIRHIEVNHNQDKLQVAVALFQAKRLLERGGLVHIAADGFQGSGGVLADFKGRRREFRSGFAELAVSGRAAVVPGYVLLRPGGGVTVQFREPLPPPAADLPGRDEAADLVRAYIACLNQVWQENPENIGWLHMEQFLQLPQADDRANGIK